MQISNRDVEEVRIKEEEQIKDDVLETVNIKKMKPESMLTRM